MAPSLDRFLANPYPDTMNAIENLSVAQLKHAVEIRERIESLEQDLAGILGGGGDIPTRHRRKKMSAAARAKIAAAQRARWAKQKGTSENPKRKMSASARAAISAAAKARWKKAKAAGRTTL